MELPALIDPPILAQRIGIGVGCLAKWRLTGQGPPFIRVGRRILYDPRDVASWLESRRRTSTTSAD